MKRLSLLLAGLAMAGLLWPGPAYAESHGDLTVGLVSCYDLDEESGPRYDAWSEYDLTANNNPGYAAGVVGNAVTLAPADSQFLSLNNNDLKYNGSFTISSWVRRGDIVAHRTIAARTDNSGGNNNEWFLSAHNDARISLFFRFNNTSYSVFSEAVFANIWYFVVTDYDASNQRLSIQLNDGSVVTTNDVPAPPSIENIMFSIGRPTGWGGSYFNGRVDQFVFTRNLLTADQRTWLYNSGNGRSCADIIATGDVEPDPTPTPPPGSTPTPPPPGSIVLPGAVYDIELPGGDLGAVVMAASAGELFIVLALMGMGVLMLFNLVVRTANAMRGGK